ncbi:MAG: hypothetical protein F4Z12_09620 [Acidobacteria bacterium]|nr:hypothetical protein [Acidobacteriota bacterium]MXZ61103.1 hypothetical protein [Acidobacteriota bacterium]MYA44781.1 hypothetical protein [Acidobacteriota bacterium]MYI40089.1 hypothetical protein [Acidobacteriota bacterium]
MPDSLRRLLIDPRLDQVESTIREVSRIIDQQFNAEFGVDLYFAGHGKHGTGNLVLRDGVLSPARFLRLQADDAEKHEDTTRTVGVMLDSCYSGAFLIRLAIDAYERYQCFRMDDSHVSCLPDEQCYELDVLGHGVFTYTTLHPGNASVDARSFGQAILDNDKSQIAKGLQGLVATMSSATAYLTEGRQCSLSLIKSSFLEVDGGFASSTLGENPDFQTAVRELTSFKIAK